MPHSEALRDRSGLKRGSAHDALAIPSSSAQRGIGENRWYLLRGPWLWVVPVTFFTLVAVLEATHARIGYHFADQPAIGLTLRGQPLAWTDFLARTLPSWLVFGLLAPFAILAARRFPLTGTRWRTNFGIHVASATIFAIVFIVAAAVLRHRIFLHSEIGVSLTATILRYYAVYFNTFFFNYWALVAVHSALRYHQRHREALALESQLTQARLAALQAQVRPHFLFNALNAISALARAGEVRKVPNMLAALSELLRTSFRDPAVQLIPLREELELLGHYIALEQLRFSDRLTVTVDAHDSALDAAVPRLLLQPLVENAMRHGIASSAGAGTVTIAARCAGGIVSIEVRDTGTGPPDAVRTGTGLENTRSRLNGLFGAAASLDLRRANGGGAIVTVRFPQVRPDVVPTVAMHRSELDAAGLTPDEESDDTLFRTVSAATASRGLP